MFLEKSFLAFSRCCVLLVSDLQLFYVQKNKPVRSHITFILRWHCCDSDLVSFSVQPLLPALVITQTTIVTLSHGPVTGDLFIYLYLTRHTLTRVCHDLLNCTEQFATSDKLKTEYTKKQTAVTSMIVHN